MNIFAKIKYTLSGNLDLALKYEAEGYPPNMVAVLVKLHVSESRIVTNLEPTEEDDSMDHSNLEVFHQAEYNSVFSKQPFISCE